MDQWDQPPYQPRVEPASPVRPYAVTGGRTAPRVHLALEALVWSAAAAAAHVDMSRRPPEHRAIYALCVQVRSVAEVSALLRVPLGVARVVIADMATEGLVQVYQPQLEAGRPDVSLLERVLSGLRRL
ncbi:DUF742 domain-containing protein [Streptosporangiaceae bacterium NEAU-GS5]|nr:DUF742 domain-containing protein [Streptosporangiaceae bacterium NEAU-GS5]